MGGFFGAISRKKVIYDVFFGTDYHSHLGNRRAGMIFHDAERGFQRQIHSIENTPFRTKFEGDLPKFSGNAGIGCISDTDPQPLLVRSHLGMFGISTVGIINNAEELVSQTFSGPGHQFMAMSSGKVNSTELTAALIDQKPTLVEGIRYAQEVTEKYGIPVKIASSVAEAVADADIICTLCPAKDPYLTRDMVKPGVHINAVGTFSPVTREVSSDLVAASRLYSDYTPSTKKESGEYLIPLQEGLITEDHILGSVGQLLLGQAEGRTSDDDITVFDALGLAVEDVASAKMVYLECL